jgi:hypothetical protein
MFRVSVDGKPVTASYTKVTLLGLIYCKVSASKLAVAKDNVVCAFFKPVADYFISEFYSNIYWLVLSPHMFV